jgi:hypothetical protein
MAKGSKPSTIKPEGRKACILLIRPSVASILEQIARAETEKLGTPITRNDIIVKAAAAYVAHYENEQGNLETLLALSEAHINYNVANHKYFDNRHLKKLLSAFTPCLSGQAG